MKNIQLHHADNLEIMATLPDESIDIICIDPPYLYLKNQKLERAFDEPKFFRECYRLLTKKGFIIMFGRGVSFCRWNTMIADMVIDTKTGEIGYLQKDFYGNIISPPHHKSVKTAFKEEIVWNKKMISIPAAPILRVHELVNIYTKSNGKLNDVRIPYIEAKKQNIDSIIQDVKRIKSAINSKEFEDIEHFLTTGDIKYTEKKSRNFFKNAFGERSRGLATLRTIQNGMKEKTIINELRDHYSAIHPTQKPVRLIERLLNLTIPKDKKEITIADFFAGSMSTMEAVLNLQEQNPDKIFKGIATEIDEEYFNAGKERIEKILITEVTAVK